MWREPKGKAAPKVIDRLDETQEDVERLENRRARSPSEGLRFRQCLRAICLDLFYAYQFDSSEVIGVHRGNSALSKNTNYPSFVTARSFRQALDGLISAGYVDMLSLGSEASNRTTRVRATEKLHWKMDVLKGRRASIFDSNDPIRVMRSQKGTKEKLRVGFVETEQTRQLRENLERINSNNARYFFDVDLSNFQAEFTEKKKERRLLTLADAQNERVKTDLDAIHLHRVFNNIDFSTGGRFYGAWWINFKKEFRKYITINQKETCEHDFSHIHPMLLYAEIGKEFPADYDPYTAPHGVALRAATKVAFNVMLNARRRPTRDMVEGFDARTAGMSWDHFLDGILKEHEPISKHFFSGVGGRLQRIDSDIAEAVLLRFVDMGYPCLPVHDSFITFKTLDGELPEIMRGVVKQVVGSSAYTKEKESVLSERIESFDSTDHDIDDILEGMSDREIEWFRGE
jgi:hypothetical protein